MSSLDRKALSGQTEADDFNKKLLGMFRDEGVDIGGSNPSSSELARNIDGLFSGGVGRQDRVDLTRPGVISQLQLQADTVETAQQARGLMTRIKNALARMDEGVRPDYEAALYDVRSRLDELDKKLKISERVSRLIDKDRGNILGLNFTKSVDMAYLLGAIGEVSRLQDLGAIRSSVNANLRHLPEDSKEALEAFLRGRGYYEAMKEAEERLGIGTSQKKARTSQSKELVKPAVSPEMQPKNEGVLKAIELDGASVTLEFFITRKGDRHIRVHYIDGAVSRIKPTSEWPLNELPDEVRGAIGEAMPDLQDLSPLFREAEAKKFAAKSKKKNGPSSKKEAHPPKKRSKKKPRSKQEREKPLKPKKAPEAAQVAYEIQAGRLVVPIEVTIRGEKNPIQLELTISAGKAGRVSCRIDKSSRDSGQTKPGKSWPLESLPDFVVSALAKKGSSLSLLKKAAKDAKASHEVEGTPSESAQVNNDQAVEMQEGEAIVLEGAVATTSSEESAA